MGRRRGERHARQGPCLNGGWYPPVVLVCVERKSLVLGRMELWDGCELGGSGSYGCKQTFCGQASRWERGKLSWGWGHGLERRGQNGDPENRGPGSGIGDSKCHTNDPIFATLEPSSIGGRRVALG